MPSDPIILAFDTSAAHCAAALLQGEQILASHAEAMTKGQAERLPTLVQDILTQAGVSQQDLTGIGVGVGPGNFTGIRISVAFARGLSLGLGCPAQGISTLDVISHLAPDDAVAVVPAPRDHVYAQLSGQSARHLPLIEAEALGTLHMPPAPDKLVETIALLAARRSNPDRPAPLYIKPADAAPSRDSPPKILT